MIGSRHRFHGQAGLKAVYQRGQTARGPMLSLKFAHRDSSRPYRVAVVVSRKVSKSAVKRNRIRRRLYELVRQSQVQIAGGTDLVITVFDERLADTPPAKLQAAVDELLRRTQT